MRGEEGKDVHETRSTFRSSCGWAKLP
jgi:hypothetical protein